ncbi:putative leucine-rich repeat receptor-like serine/threonine-protein kinase [Platanthera zijinensis]|uniref:Leucine-rich repeat receptor-like serine/threonine-protein kinase n=1 Tax=Platanthera zijinensis TaxID=2320716 RepID=A0AAP0BZB2_9ASPA
MDKAAEEVYNKLLELHEEQKRDKGEDKLTTEEAYTMVLGIRSGYIPGMGPGPKPLERESTNGQRLRAQIRAEVEAEMTTRNVKLYSYEDLRIATEDFSPVNKVGNRGFEPVYKETLVNGIKVAIKVLSSESTQGAKEFLSEIAAISDIVHENLVKLYGACIEGDYRILVYNYLENNRLAQTLLVPQ